MKQKKRKYSSDQVAERYSKLVVVFVVIALVIFVRAASLMFGSNHDYWMQVNRKFQKENIVLKAKRGNILAGDGEVLATTLPEYRIYLDFMSWDPDSVGRVRDQLLRDRMLFLKLDSVCSEMHRLLPDIDPVAYKDYLLEGRRRNHHRWPLYPKRITYVQYKKVQELPLLGLSKAKGGGLVHDEFFRRRNPYGLLAHSTIGSYDEERDSLRSGFEARFDSCLRGKPGKAHKEKVMNRYVQVVDSMPTEGCDVVTTFDVTMQDLVEHTLRSHLQKENADLGLCVLMDVKTGDVKAMSSQKRGRDGVYREGENRACTSRREPGSVFKPMSFMVAMDDGEITMTDGVNVGKGVHRFGDQDMHDSNWRNGGSKRRLSVTEIIKLSSNVGVSVLINNHYAKKPEKFVEGLDRIGVRADLHIPVQGYKAPYIRYPRKGDWSATTLPWMSVGYETNIPPIQTLAFYNGVANDGKMVQPRLVKEIRRGDEIVEEFPVKYVIPDSRNNMMCSPSTLKNIRTCLEAVVQPQGCTGAAAYSEHFPIAGKTGTAQIWEGGRKTNKHIVTFAGYFPADNPQYSMIVCMEGGGLTGGGSCGPVFKRVAESIWARNIPANVEQAQDSTSRRHDMPSMTGGNLHSLASVLEELGLGFNRNFELNGQLLWGGNTSKSATSADLTRDNHNMEEKSTNMTMPNVMGYGIRDALYRLERAGIKVKTQGCGRVVSQSVPANAPVKRGQEVELIFSVDPKFMEREGEDSDSIAQERVKAVATKPTQEDDHSDTGGMYD